MTFSGVIALIYIGIIMLYSQYECTCHYYVYRYLPNPTLNGRLLGIRQGLGSDRGQGPPICVWHRAPQELNPALIVDYTGICTQKAHVIHNFGSKISQYDAYSLINYNSL